MLLQIRNSLLKTLHFIVYGNLLVAFGAYSLCIFFLRIYSSADLYLQPLSLFIFFATLFTYNFHRRIGLELYGQIEYSASVNWMIAHPIISRSTTLISFAAAVYFFMDLPKSTYLLIAPLALLSLMYVIRFSDWAPLRQIPFLKIFLIALAWSSTVVFLSALSQERIIDGRSIWFFLALIFFMIAEIIPFDIRDMQSDRQTDLKTIPNFLGIRSSIWIALSSLLVSICLFLIAIDFELFNPFFICWLLASIYLLVCILLSKAQRSDLFYSLLVETSLLLPFLFSLCIG